MAEPMPLCGNEYERQGGRQRGDRIVACDLPAGHDGNHVQADTRATWPVAAPAVPHVWRARVEPDLPLDGVEIHLRRRLDVDQVQVVGPLTLQMETHIVDEGVATTAPPMLRLDDEMAGALLGALAAYYGTGHTIQGELTRLADQVEALVEALGARVDALSGDVMGGDRD